MAASRSFCSMSGPKFCALRVSHDPRYAARAQAGMEKKAREFRDGGAEIYVPSGA